MVLLRCGEEVRLDARLETLLETLLPEPVDDDDRKVGEVGVEPSVPPTEATTPRP